MLTEGGDDMPADPFDRSPDNYDVSDTLAALEKNDAEDDDDDLPDSELATDGGTITPTEDRVPCDYCGGNTIGYDLKEQANLCSDCAVFPSALVEGRSQVTQVDEFPAPPTDDESESSSRCIECGDLLVVRDGQDTRCVECLLDHLAVDPRPSPGVF